MHPIPYLPVPPCHTTTHLSDPYPPVPPCHTPVYLSHPATLLSTCSTLPHPYSPVRPLPTFPTLSYPYPPVTHLYPPVPPCQTPTHLPYPWPSVTPCHIPFLPVPPCQAPHPCQTLKHLPGLESLTRGFRPSMGVCPYTPHWLPLPDIEASSRPWTTDRRVQTIPGWLSLYSTVAPPARRWNILQTSEFRH